MKLNLVLIITLATVLIILQYYHYELNNTKQKINIYQKNQNQLIANIRRIYHEKTILQQEKIALEELALKDKSLFDWHIDISNTSVIKRLQAN